jgi:O-antigen/teichoic acid export membrane protein
MPEYADSADAATRSDGARPRAGDARSSGDTISANAAYSFLAQIAGAAFTAAITFFLARKLGTHGFGVYSLSLGFGALLLFPSDFGISTAAARFIAERRGDPAAVAQVLADSLKLKLLVSLAMSVLLFALAAPIASAYGVKGLLWPLRAAALALFGQSVMQMVKVFSALARVRLQLTTALAESVVETAATIALVLAGAGVTGAAFGRTIGYTVGAALTLALLVRLGGPRSLPRGLRLGANTRRIVTYGGVILVTDGAFTLFNQIDILIIGGYLGAAAVGVFSAPLRLTALLGYGGNAISSGVSPRLARNTLEGPNVGAFLSALRVLLILQAAVTAFVLGWAPLIVRVALGRRYEDSVEVLRVLAPFVFLLGFGPLVSGTVNYLGEARRRVPIAFATTALNMAIDFVLVPRIGVVGGSIGTDVAYGVYAPAHLLICQRALDLDLRATARTLARTFTAGALTTGALLLVGDPLAHLWRIPLGAIAGLVVYLLVLFASGEVTRAEVSSLLARARRLRERTGEREGKRDRPEPGGGPAGPRGGR